MGHGAAATCQRCSHHKNAEFLSLDFATREMSAAALTGAGCPATCRTVPVVPGCRTPQRRRSVRASAALDTAQRGFCILNLLVPVRPQPLPSSSAHADFTPVRTPAVAAPSLISFCPHDTPRVEAPPNAPPMVILPGFGNAARD